LLLVVIAAVTITLASGSSLRGGIGDTTLAPATVSSVASHYRLGVGHLDVDLSAVKFPPGDRTVSVSLGVGQLSVQVPSATVVMVDAHSGVGDVDVFGLQGSDVNLESRLHGRVRLTIDAHVGIGAIRVTQPAGP
jgi:predicted membrane protein